MERRTVAVSGMSCTRCEETTERALGRLDGVRRVEADHEAGTVELVAGDEVTTGEIHAAIEQAGFDSTG